MQGESARQDSVDMERIWNLQHSKFVNHNGAKMVDIWNVNKLTKARTKVEVYKVGSNVKKTNTNFGISVLNMEYVIRNMSILIPCQEPLFPTSQ